MVSSCFPFIFVVEDVWVSAPGLRCLALKCDSASSNYWGSDYAAGEQLASVQHISFCTSAHSGAEGQIAHLKWVPQ